MKENKLIPILILLLACFGNACAQLADDITAGSTVTVSGGYGTISNGMADWSVGNLVSETYATASTYQLSQGFLQPDYSAILVTLDFAQLPGKTYGDVSFQLHATASNGKEIVYTSSDENVAIIVNGNMVQILNAGTTDITATIKGTTISVTHKLVVDKATQTITFEIIPTLIAKGNSYTVNATASSGLTPVNISSSDVFIIRVNGTILEPLDIGKVLVTLSQEGNANYHPVSVTQWVQVTDVDGGKIKVPTLITPNGDGVNDVLQITGIENYPDNRLIVVNRNGTKIFDVRGYDNGQALFTGRPQEQAFEGKTFFKDEYLPQGTYFYVLNYRDSETGESGRKTGFFVLKY